MSSRSIDTLTLFDSSNYSQTEQNTQPSGFAAQLYLEFGASVGHTLWLIIPASIWSLISIMGIMMNSSVVYVTARSMDLRNTCNYLMALTCIFEVFHQLSHFVYFGNVTFGSNFIDLLTCTKIQLLPVFGLLSIQASLLAVAVDRLISLFAPIFYKNLNRRSSDKLFYLIIIVLAVVAFGLYACYYFYTTISSFSWSPVVCSIADVVTMGEVYNFYIYSICTMNMLSFLIYCFIWLAGKKFIQAQSMQKQLLKSLGAIVCVNIGGYSVNLVLMNIYIMTLTSNFKLFWVLYEFNGALLNICAAINAPILYWISSDYRKAFKYYLFERVGCTTHQNFIIIQRSK